MPIINPSLFELALPSQRRLKILLSDGITIEKVTIILLMEGKKDSDDSRQAGCGIQRDAIFSFASLH